MKTVTHEIGTGSIDGKTYKIVRNYFIHPKKVDWFKETHKEFSYNQKKIAILQHKNNK